MAFTYDQPFHMSQNISSCPWIKQSHQGKCRNEKLLTWTLVNDGNLRMSSRFHINTRQYLITLKYLICLWWRRTLLENCKIMKTSMGEILYNNLQKFLSLFTCNFAKEYLNSYFPMKLLWKESVKNSAKTSEIKISNYKGFTKKLVQSSW